MLISQQSFFIAGLEDVDVAKDNAFGAMGMFLVTFVLSLVGIWYDNNHKQEPISADEAAEGYRLASGEATTYGTST